ncbi:MAG: thiamine-phosphate kinase [Halioglobus sp.]|nr:thiamine-phosphate kinase [Halioglobus sp.]
MPLSEFDIIYRYFSALGRGDSVQLSVGDDCAILGLRAGERVATSVDTLVAGVHFFPDSFPEDVGYRAVAVAASDLAAMGARPLGMTIALTLPDADELWLHAFSEGVAAAVSDLQLPLVGGDTTRGPLTVSVQVIGALPGDAALLRGGAREGDSLCVTGTLGDAAAALAFLRGDWQPPPDHAQFLHERFYRPRPPLGLGQRLRGVATAAIDVSDGLLADARHVADASGVRLEIDSAALPLSAALHSHVDRDRAIQWALTGGDDYELCYCLPAGVAPPEGTVIGRVVAGQGVHCDVAAVSRGGYDHFAEGGRLQEGSESS